MIIVMACGKIIDTNEGATWGTKPEPAWQSDQSKFWVLVIVQVQAGLGLGF